MRHGLLRPLQVVVAWSKWQRATSTQLSSTRLALSMRGDAIDGLSWARSFFGSRAPFGSASRSWSRHCKRPAFALSMSRVEQITPLPWTRDDKSGPGVGANTVSSSVMPAAHSRLRPLFHMSSRVAAVLPVLLRLGTALAPTARPDSFAV